MLNGAVWCLQGEKGLQGRPGPTGPVGIGEPGLPVSRKHVLIDASRSRAQLCSFNGQVALIKVSCIYIYTVCNMYITINIKLPVVEEVLSKWKYCYKSKIVHSKFQVKEHKFYQQNVPKVSKAKVLVKQSISSESVVMMHWHISSILTPYNVG